MVDINDWSDMIGYEKLMARVVNTQSPDNLVIFSMMDVSDKEFKDGEFPPYREEENKKNNHPFYSVIIVNTNIKKLDNFPIERIIETTKITIYNNPDLLIHQDMFPLNVWETNLDSISLTSLILSNPNLEDFYTTHKLWDKIDWLDVLSFFPQALNLWKLYGDPDLLTLQEILEFYPDTKLYL